MNQRDPRTPAPVGAILLVVAACAVGLYAVWYLALGALGDPPYFGVWPALAAGASAPVVFAALAVMGARQTHSGRGAAWPSVAVALVPACLGVFGGVLQRVPPVVSSVSSVAAAASSVRAQEVAESVLGPGALGMVTSACALLAVGVGATCAYWVKLRQAGLTALSGLRTSGRAIASSGAYVVIFVFTLGVSRPLSSPFVSAASVDTAWIWWWAKTVACVVAASVSVPLAMTGQLVSRANAAESSWLWRRGVSAATSSALSLAFLVWGEYMSESRPFGRSEGHGADYHPVVAILSCAPIAVGLAIGLWPSWSARRGRMWPALRGASTPLAVMACVLCALPTAEGCVEPPHHPDDRPTSTFPCVVAVRGASLEDGNVLRLTLALSNQMRDDLRIDGDGDRASGPGWYAAEDQRVVPAGATVTVELRKSVAGRDFAQSKDRDIAIVEPTLLVSRGARRGTLLVPRTEVPVPAALRKQVERQEWPF